jgi:hypothetical protein
MGFAKDDIRLDKPCFEIFFRALLRMKARRVVIRQFIRGKLTSSCDVIGFCFLNPFMRQRLHTAQSLSA